MTRVIPHLTCRNAAEAYEFYQRAFGAQPMGLLNSPDGLVMHASLGFDGAPVYLHDEFPDHGVMGPQAIGGTPVTIHLQVDDCDAVYSKAVEAGCAATMPLAEMFWGDRFGHRSVRPPVVRGDHQANADPGGDAEGDGGRDGERGLGGEADVERRAFAPGFPSARTSPPCRRTIRSTVARPIPWPGNSRGE